MKKYKKKRKIKEKKRRGGKKEEATIPRFGYIDQCYHSAGDTGF